MIPILSGSVPLYVSLQTLLLRKYFCVLEQAGILLDVQPAAF